MYLVRLIYLAFGVFFGFHAMAVAVALGIRTAEEWSASSNEVALWLIPLALAACMGIAVGLSKDE